MPDLRDLADVEKVLVVALKADVGFGPFVGQRVSTELPRDFTAEKRLRLFRVGGTEDDAVVGHLDRALVQIDAYGATKAEAFSVAARGLTALRRARGAHPGAVVTDVERVSGPTWSPDPASDIPRYLLTVAVTVHPTA